MIHFFSSSPSQLHLQDTQSGQHHPPTKCLPLSSPALTPLSSLPMTALRSPYVHCLPMGWVREGFEDARKSSENRVAWGATTSNLEISRHRIDFAAANSNFSLQADKIQTILGAAKIQEVEPIWSSIFAKVNTRTLPRRCLIRTSPFCDPRSLHNVRHDHSSSVTYTFYSAGS